MSGYRAKIASHIAVTVMEVRRICRERGRNIEPEIIQKRFDYLEKILASKHAGTRGSIQGPFTRVEDRYVAVGSIERALGMSKQPNVFMYWAYYMDLRYYRYEDIMAYTLANRLCPDKKPPPPPLPVPLAKKVPNVSPKPTDNKSSEFADWVVQHARTLQIGALAVSSASLVVTVGLALTSTGIGAAVGLPILGVVLYAS